MVVNYDRKMFIRLATGFHYDVNAKISLRLQLLVNEGYQSYVPGKIEPGSLCLKANVKPLWPF